MASRWYAFAHWAFVLTNSRSVPFVKWKGALLLRDAPAELLELLNLDRPSTRQPPLIAASDHLLTGLLFDDAGHRMIPTHASKAGIRYRYYASLPHLKGESKTVSVGSVSRTPVADIDATIARSVNLYRAS